MIISYTHELPMGHRLQNHGGKCKHLHGHNYLITVSVKGEVGADGMVIDFHILKHLVREYFSPWDHAMVLEDNDPTEVKSWAKVIRLRNPPTAEVLAMWWFEHLKMDIPQLCKLVVNETRDCSVEVGA